MHGQISKINFQPATFSTSRILYYLMRIQASLQRLAFRDPDRCKKSIKTLLQSEIKNPKWSVFYETNVDKDDFMLAAKVNNMENIDKHEMFSLLSSIYDSVSSCNSDNDGNEHNLTEESLSIASHSNYNSKDATIKSAQSFYFTVVKDFCYITLPVFQMRCHSLYPGVQFNLTLFEPRYQMMIREAMAGRRSSELRGKLLKQPRPRFVFCYTRRIPTTPGTTAYLVEITRCRMLEAGRAQIMINPLKKIKLARVGLRPGVSNGLLDAQIKRFE